MCPLQHHDCSFLHLQSQLHISPCLKAPGWDSCWPCCGINAFQSLGATQLLGVEAWEGRNAAAKPPCCLAAFLLAFKDLLCCAEPHVGSQQILSQVRRDARWVCCVLVIIAMLRITAVAKGCLDARIPSEPSDAFFSDAFAFFGVSN